LRAYRRKEAKPGKETIMKISKLNGFACLINIVMLASFSEPALAKDKYIQEIKNKSSTTANDLTIKFTEGVTSFIPIIVVGDDKYPATFDLGTNSYKWATGKLPEYKTGDVAAVRFESRFNARIDVTDTSSYWTQDGFHILDSLASVAQHGSIKPHGVGGAIVTLTNASEGAIVYTGLQFYANNAIGNFDLDRFEIPTGVLAAGLPDSLVLDPFQSASFVFGGIELGSYQLFLADVAAVSTPTEIFRIGFAAAIPEPSSWALALIGFGGLGSALRWRRRSSRFSLC